MRKKSTENPTKKMRGSASQTCVADPNEFTDEEDHGQRLLENLLEFLRGLPAFSFALTSDGCYGTGPTLISALELVYSASRDLPYRGPFPESDFAEAREEAVQRHREIIKIVTQRVQQLQESGATFALAWQAYAEAQPHVDYSGDYNSLGDAMDVLVDHIQQETERHLNL